MRAVARAGGSEGLLGGGGDLGTVARLIALDLLLAASRCGCEGVPRRRELSAMEACTEGPRELEVTTVAGGMSGRCAGAGGKKIGVGERAIRPDAPAWWSPRASE